MARDSLFGEKIIWIGRPKVLETPHAFRAMTALLVVVGISALAFSAAVGLALGVGATGLVVFAAWSFLLAAATTYGPRIWASKARYVVTSGHVVCHRPPFRRTIDRNAITFARIFWSEKHAGVGDLELVRAVPTGVFRRRLRLRLESVAAPDRVWAIVRGVATTAPGGLGERPVTQRLDDGERVVWSARPKPTLRAWIPHGSREISLVLVAVILLGVLARMVSRAVPNMAELLAAGLPATSPAFVALLIGQALGAGVVATIAGYLLYDTVIRPARLMRRTSYLITNRRVLIQRGREELHLDRPCIVDVIDHPLKDGLSDVFLVLDGPRARAVATSGAFGELERGPSLRPVLESLEDAESVRKILRAEEPDPPLSHAA